MPPKPMSKSVVPTKAVAPNRPLPAKDAVLFKQVLTLYEQRSWKKGIKAADAILKTHPEHGETLAMKGLFFTNVDRKAEGYELVKRGVRNDLRSHIVWHVYGLMHRADKNYEEALKCYVQANRIEKDSLNILVDLSVLSAHLRLYTAYSAARHAILNLQPRTRRNWTALAVAQHLDGQYADADKTLSNYEASVKDMPEGEFEHSEVIMYHAMLLEEWGQFERCLEFLGENSQAIVDRTGFATQRARLLFKLGRSEPAEWAWSALVEENPDSYEYIKACVAARGGDFDSKTAEGITLALKLLDDLAASHPRSLAIRRLTLDIASGEEFRTRASKYLTNALSKGIPSVFADMKALYSDLDKRTIIGELTEGYRKSLETDGKFAGAVEGETEEDTVEASSAYLWTLFFLAQHHSSLGASSQPAALAILALAESHTPSLPELSMLKARILKRGGDTIGAMRSMGEARALDGQDRFLNSKDAKYLLRADRVSEAEAVVGLFTKKDATSPLDDLVDMQCLWLLEEEGDSYVRQSKYALALKRYHQIFATFDEIEDDQFDFHSYCSRKSTLRSYIDLMRYSDGLRAHARYQSTAKSAINIYLRLHDDPKSVVAPALTNGAALAAKEEKKAENKAKKVDKGKKVAKKADEDEHVPAPIVDLDPLGEELLATKNPLGAAAKWLKPLETCAKGSEGTWELSYEVNIRQKKYLLALRALRTLHSIAPLSSALHLLVIRFVTLLSTISDSLSEVILTAINAALPEFYDGPSLEAFNSSYLQKGLDVVGLVTVTRGTMFIRGESATSEVESLLFSATKEQLAADLPSTLSSLEILQSINSSRVEEFKVLASQIFPLAIAFRSAEATSSLTNGIEGETEKENLED